MKFTTLLTGFVVVIAFSSAQAADVSWDGGASTTNWGDANNWSGNTLPGQADRVTIGSSFTDVHLNVNATVGLVVIQGVLKIDANKTLTIDGQASVGTDGDNQIPGTIELEGSASVLRFDDRNQQVSGAGSIKGEDPNSAIEIEDTFTLTSYMKIEGTMVMRPTGAGTAKFANTRSSTAEQGQIVANVDNPFVFDADLILDDAAHFVSGPPAVTYRPLYKVSGPGSSYGSNKLLFNRLQDGSDATNNPELVGRFEFVSCGTMEFLATVKTQGPRSVWTAGRILTNGAGAPTFSYGCPSCTTIDDSASVGGCS